MHWVLSSVLHMAPDNNHILSRFVERELLQVYKRQVMVTGSVLNGVVPTDQGPFAVVQKSSQVCLILLELQVDLISVVAP